MTKCLVFIAVWLLVSPSYATTARMLNFSELVNSANTVVLTGQVVGSGSFWQGTRIYTLVQVKVDETWVGKQPKSALIDVLTLGGVVGDIGQHVDGAAVLPTERQLVLHLHQAASGEYVPLGMAQGVWVVESQKLPAKEQAKVTRINTDRLIAKSIGNQAMRVPTTLGELKKVVLEAYHAR